MELVKLNSLTLGLNNKLLYQEL